MRLTNTRDISTPGTPAPAAEGAAGDGFFSRLGRLFRRTATPSETVLVKVWDSRRGQYREVDLSNREDPLWFAAKALAGMQGNLSGRSAA